MLIAHRGGSGHHQENSLAAFEHAIRSGCDGAELDVFLSADGVAMVHHSAYLDARYTRANDGHWLTPDEQWPINELSYDTLRGFRIGRANPASDYASLFPDMCARDDQYIPTLTEVITLAQRLSSTFKLVIEIKSTCRFTAGARCWQPVVDAIFEIIRSHGFAHRTIFCGFDWRALRYAKSRHFDIPVWMTTDPFAWRDGNQAAPTDLAADASTQIALQQGDGAGACWYDGFRPASAWDAPRAVRAAGGDAWFPYYSDCNAATIAQARRAKIGIAAWTVNLRNPNRRRQLAALELDAICVDYF